MQQEHLANGTPVFITQSHRFGQDALLLAHFCRVRRAEAVCDLGTGCGVIPLRWHDRGHRGPCLALDIAPGAVAQLHAAVQAAEAWHITPVTADLRDLAGLHPYAQSCDVVACNPPYFTAGFQSSDPARATARHETDCALDDVCKCAFRLLKDGGRLSLCHRPERLAEVLAVLRAYRLEPKRLAFVKNQPDAAPWLFLMEAQKNRKTGLRIEPDVLLSTGAALYGK